MTTDRLILPAEDIPATPFAIPGAEGEFRIQILNEDSGRGVVTSIVHLPAGGRIPAHVHHAGAEMHFVLEGDLMDSGQTHGPGGFLTHAAGVVHGPHESRGGARVLTVQQWQSSAGSFDFNLAEGDTQDRAPRQDGGETSQATPAPEATPVSQATPASEAPMAAEGDPTRDAAEQSVGRGYG